MLAFMGWNLLGKNADSFRDFAWTFNTVMLMATGDSPDFSEVFWRREPFFGIVRVSARLAIAGRRMLSYMYCCCVLCRTCTSTKLRLSKFTPPLYPLHF